MRSENSLSPARIAGPAVAVAASLLLAACGSKEEAKAAPARPTLTVTAATAALTAIPRTIEGSGTVAAWQEVPVGSEAGGLTATGVFVDEGAYVRQGQVLVKLNDDLIRAELRQQDAQVASARAQLAQATAALTRAQELRERGYLAPATLDARLAEQRTAAANVQSAQAGRAASLERLEQTNVRAPVSGLITARTVVKGQIVPAGQELFRLVREGQIELNAQIPESELRLIRPGMTATVSGDEVGIVTGRVRLVTPQVDPQNRLGLARISLPGGAGFRPGMFARASIDVGAAPAVVVPQSAVLYRQNKAAVFVIDGGGRARLRVVQPGARVGDQVEIESGLQAGQRVAVQGAGFLAEGDLVRVAAKAPAAGGARTGAAGAR
ncbi:MAG TPA: efflux RND transporter periplasmic adaptor subunit [Caulobacteraceae bacterium]|nr:efflux RND transporter periplasmic adaptor subunit [Caulobacteraceae bacterium]